VYLLLGAAGSGRREVLADLIEGGLAEGDRACVFLPAGEQPSPADTRLGEAGRWRLIEGIVAAELPPDATHAFFLFDGRTNPVDQIEAFMAWIRDRPVELGRVICVVNCRLLEQNPKLFAWYEACVHFSDVVLLNQREGVPNRWIGEFRGKFEDKYYPCLFEFVKEGAVKNPPLILAPVARRMSHVFDEPDWTAVDEDDDEELQEEGEEVPMEEVVDPYLLRRNGGRRVHELPHIEEYLSPGPGESA
jgi:hypothetical protein